MSARTWKRSSRGNCDERAVAQEVHFIQSLLPRASAVAGVAQDVRRRAVPPTNASLPQTTLLNEAKSYVCGVTA